jgi:hypothetical protein
MRAGVRPNPRPQPAPRARPHAQLTATLLDVPLTGRALLAYGSPSHRTRRLGPSGSRSLTQLTEQLGQAAAHTPETAPAGAAAPTPPPRGTTRGHPPGPRVFDRVPSVSSRAGARPVSFRNFRHALRAPRGPSLISRRNFLPPPPYGWTPPAPERDRRVIRGMRPDRAHHPTRRTHNRGTVRGTRKRAATATASVTTPLPTTVPTRLTQTNRDDRFGVSTNRQGDRTDRPPPERKPTP